jgi:NAD(P)-dependent dehydrogenase (short-subunit alcohol dehydrogenase family)
MSSQQTQQPHVVVITGTSRGIGEACVQHCASKPNRLVIGSIQESSAPDSSQFKCGDGTQVEYVTNVDLSGDEGVAVFADAVMKHIENKQIQSFTLINNAGVGNFDSLQEGFDRKKFEQNFKVDAIAPLFVATNLLQALRKAPKGQARIVNISSKLGSISSTDTYTQYPGCYAYRAAKAALNSFTVSLAHDLKSEDIAVYAIHPGYVSTQITDFKGDISPEESIANVHAVLDKLTPELTGTFWDLNGKNLPW